MNRRKALIATALTIMGLSSIGTGVYAAQTKTIPKPMNNLVSAIAKKFNLNEADIQKVFDEQHQAMSQQRQANLTQRLTGKLDLAVKNGKLTQTQKDLVIAKHTEVQSFMASLKDKNAADKQAAIKIQMDSLKQWATDNKIPEQFVLFARGGMGQGMKKGLGQGFKMGFMMGKYQTKNTVR